ncbi:MAG: hypothetical protein ACE5KM_04640 [Planctomycetaceae bacterium]
MKQLEDAVRACHGDVVAETLGVPTRSIGWKIEMGHYHACESVQILKRAIYDSDVIADNEHEAIAASKAILLSAVGHASAPPLNDARVRAEAHMIAAAQSLHSTADIMASVAYWALDFPCRTNPPREHRLNLYQVRKHLQYDPDCAEITNSITNFVDLHQFKYLTGYVNTTKHRSLVGVQYSAHTDPRDNPRQGLRIRAFQYRDGVGNIHSYDQIWGEDFLFSEAQLIRDGILTIGNSLNRYFANTTSDIVT